MFMEYELVNDNSSMKGVGNKITKVMGKGTIILKFDLRVGKSMTHKLRNVLHLPTARNCLLLISKLMEIGGYTEFTNKKMNLKAKNGRIIGIGELDHGLYTLKA